MALAVRVAKEKAERTRRRLVAAGVFDRSRQVGHEGGFVLLPIARRFGRFKAVEAELPLQKEPSQSLERRLEGVLPAGSFHKSFDIIGSVGILDVPQLAPARQQYAAAALKDVYKGLTAVCTRAGNIEDEYRVRPLKLLIGESTETLHLENGVRLKLDPAKVYFSPRQAAERARIESLVGRNEEILVMFAGIGPFSILMAKKHPDCAVTSIELNPHAFRYLEENIRLNGVGGNSRASLGDVAKVVPSLGAKFDRIIMPLPKNAGDYLDVAAAAAKPGATIHFYSFGRDFSDAEKLILSKLHGATIVNRQKCGDIAPGKYRLVFDIKLP